MTKSLAFVFALLFFASLASAQGIRFDSTAETVNNNCQPSALCPILAVPGATVQLCNSYPDCAAPGVAYTDQTLGTSCPSYAPVTLPGSFSCQTTVGPQGQFGFWVSTGTSPLGYELIFPNGTIYGPFPFTVGGGTVSLPLNLVVPLPSTNPSVHPNYSDNYVGAGITETMGTFTPGYLFSLPIQAMNEFAIAIPADANPSVCGGGLYCANFGTPSIFYSETKSGAESAVGPVSLVVAQVVDTTSVGFGHATYTPPIAGNATSIVLNISSLPAIAQYQASLGNAAYQFYVRLNNEDYAVSGLTQAGTGVQTLTAIPAINGTVPVSHTDGIATIYTGAGVYGSNNLQICGTDVEGNQEVAFGCRMIGFENDLDCANSCIQADQILAQGVSTLPPVEASHIINGQRFGAYGSRLVYDITTPNQITMVGYPHKTKQYQVGLLQACLGTASAYNGYWVATSIVDSMTLNLGAAVGGAVGTFVSGFTDSVGRYQALLSGVSGTIVLGLNVSGTNVFAGTTVLGFANNYVVLSHVPSGTLSGVMTFTVPPLPGTTGTCGGITASVVSGSASSQNVTIGGVAGGTIVPGDLVTGTNIPTGTTVANIVGAILTLSGFPSGTPSGTLRFSSATWTLLGEETPTSSNSVLYGTGSYTIPWPYGYYCAPGSCSIGLYLGSQIAPFTPYTLPSDSSPIVLGNWNGSFEQLAVIKEVSSGSIQQCDGNGSCTTTYQVAYNPITFNWSQTPGGTLTAGSDVTITLPDGAPRGVNGTNTNYWVEISSADGTVTEPVLINDGTCVSNAAGPNGTPCTIIATTLINTYTGAWTVGSASLGGAEADRFNGGAGNIAIEYPDGNYTIHGPIAAHGNVAVHGNGRGITTFTLASDFPTSACGIISCNTDSTGITVSEMSDFTVVLPQPFSLCANPCSNLIAQINTTGTASSGSTALTIALGTGTINGQYVYGAGIAPGTTVASGGGTTSIVLSANTTASLSTTPVVFSGFTHWPPVATILGGALSANRIRVDGAWTGLVMHGYAATGDHDSLNYPCTTVGGQNVIEDVQMSAYGPLGGLSFDCQGDQNRIHNFHFWPYTNNVETLAAQSALSTSSVRAMVASGGAEGAASTTGTALIGNTALTIANGAGTANGQNVAGPGIFPGSIVSSGGGTTSIVLSHVTSAALSATPVVFYTPHTGIAGILISDSQFSGGTAFDLGDGVANISTTNSFFEACGVVKAGFTGAADFTITGSRFYDGDSGYGASVCSVPQIDIGNQGMRVAMTGNTIIHNATNHPEIALQNPAGYNGAFDTFLFSENTVISDNLSPGTTGIGSIFSMNGAETGGSAMNAMINGNIFSYATPSNATTYTNPMLSMTGAAITLTLRGNTNSSVGNGVFANIASTSAQVNITDNWLESLGIGTWTMSPGSGSGKVVNGNVGYNPVGSGALTCTYSTGTCTLPATPTPSNSTIYITTGGGTVTGVGVGTVFPGTAVCSGVPCYVTVPPNQQVFIAGSGTPPVVIQQIQ